MPYDPANLIIGRDMAFLMIRLKKTEENAGNEKKHDCPGLRPFRSDYRQGHKDSRKYG